MFDIPSNAVSNLIKLQNCLVKRGKHLDLEGECSQPTDWGSRVGVGASANLGLRHWGRASRVDRWGGKVKGVSGKASSSRLLIGSRHFISRLLIGSRRFSFHDFESVEKKII